MQGRKEWWGREGCRKRRVLATETEIRVSVWGLERASCAAVCMLHLVACQKSAAGDGNAVKLKAIVSALPFALSPSFLWKLLFMTKAGRYYTMDLHLSPNTALPIWNNKQTYSVFPASTPELVRLHVTTTAKVKKRRPKVCAVLLVGPSSLLELKQEGLNNSMHGWNNW